MSKMAISYNCACCIAFGQHQGQTRMLLFPSVKTVLCFVVEALLTGVIQVCIRGVG